MRLIADSGSTKTDWALVENGKAIGRYQTQGINPFHQDRAMIEAILREELLPQLPSSLCQHPSADHSLYFYGSGLREELRPTMRQVFKTVFPTLFSVACFENDLLGAARALCGHREGMACILGTGANSCLYDGEKITQNTPPLGYVLGDEGSGAVLGKLFLNALFKDAQFATLQEAFLRDTGLTMPAIINKVYREPLANRFLASTSAFVHQHLDFEPLRRLVVDNFRAFFRRNLAPYRRQDLPVHAIGSIAYYYQEELGEAAVLEGFNLGTITRSPLEGLVDYHQ